MRIAYMNFWRNHMNRSKKHHYVPQAYLRFFTAANDNTNQLAVYDKEAQKYYIRSITDIAEERNYNYVNPDDTILYPIPNDDPEYYEKLYSDLIENRIPKIIKTVLGNCLLKAPSFPVLDERNRTELAQFLIIQMLRTPRAREYFTRIGESVFEKKKRQLWGQLLPKYSFASIEHELSKITYTSATAKSMILQHITNSDNIDRYTDYILNNFIWILFSNSNPFELPYITSDEPILLVDIKGQKTGLEMNPIGNENTAICTPLNERILLMLYSKYSIIGNALAEHNDQILSADKRFVMRINLLMLDQCTRQIYTSSENRHTLEHIVAKYKNRS